MAVTKKYPAQLVIVTSDEMAGYVKAESDADEVSGAAMSRELMELGRGVREHSKRTGWDTEALLGVLAKVQPLART